MSVLIHYYQLKSLFYLYFLAFSIIFISLSIHHIYCYVYGSLHFWQFLKLHLTLEDLDNFENYWLVPLLGFACFLFKWLDRDYEFSWRKSQRWSIIFITLWVSNFITCHCCLLLDYLSEVVVLGVSYVHLLFLPFP